DLDPVGRSDAEIIEEDWQRCIAAGVARPGAASRTGRAALPGLPRVAARVERATGATERAASAPAVTSLAGRGIAPRIGARFDVGDGYQTPARQERSQQRAHPAHPGILSCLS